MTTSLSPTDLNTEDAGATFLVELAYVSAATRVLSTADLEEILRGARRRNATRGITGILLYHEGSFLQVLEGPANIVDGVFATISDDARHGHVQLVSRRIVGERSFAEWQMGFIDLSHHAWDIDGFVDFFRDGVRVCRDDHDTRPVERLLDGFREGRWHQRFS